MGSFYEGDFKLMYTYVSSKLLRNKHGDEAILLNVEKTTNGYFRHIAFWVTRTGVEYVKAVSFGFSKVEIALLWLYITINRKKFIEKRRELEATLA